MLAPSHPLPKVCVLYELFRPDGVTRLCPPDTCMGRTQLVEHLVNTAGIELVLARSENNRRVPRREDEAFLGQSLHEVIIACKQRTAARGNKSAKFVVIGVEPRPGESRHLAQVEYGRVRPNYHLAYWSSAPEESCRPSVIPDTT